MDGIALRPFTSDGTADGTIAGIFDGVKLGFNIMGDGDRVGSKINQKEGKVIVCDFKGMMEDVLELILKANLLTILYKICLGPLTGVSYNAGAT